MPLPATVNILPMPTKDNIWPKEGPRAIPLNFDFTANGSYFVDLTIQANAKRFSFIQTVFVDNSKNSKAVSLVFDVLNQSINVPGGMQGYFPVLVVNPPRITVTSLGGTSASVFLLNFPVAPALWAGTGTAFSFDANGNLLVSDTALEAAIAGGKMLTQEYVSGNADVTMPLFGGNEISVKSVNAAGDTVVIPAQGVAAGWFLKHVDVWISGDASLAVAGELTFELKDGANIIMASTINLPAAAGTGFGQTILRMSNLNYNSKAFNNALNANLSVALTTGQIVINVCWGATSNLTP